MDNGVKQLLEFGPFRVDPMQRLLLRDEQPIPLSPKAFDLLLVLLQRSGEVVLKDDLMKTLWPDTFVEESNLGQHVFQIRKALGEKPQDRSYIVTVPGRGYRFAQKVRVLPHQEMVVVESYSTARVVIEQNVPVGRVNQPTTLLQFPERTIEALPAPANGRKARLESIMVLVSIGVVLTALALWVLWPVPVPKVVRSVQLTHSGRVEPYGAALTDGSRVYFGERFGGTSRLAMVPEQGGDSTPIPTSIGNITLYDIDRGRARLLVTWQGTTDALDPVWIVSTAGGSARRLGDVMARYAVWSPDGQQIAYSTVHEIMIVGDDGQQSHKIFSTPGALNYLRWSPDGQRLTFTIRDANAASVSLFEIAPDGTNLRPISFGWKAPTHRFGEGECCGDWSPDGSYFLFRSHRDGVESVWLLPERKAWFRRPAQPVQLYTSSDRINRPRFSADGKKILFTNYKEKRELVRYDAAKGLFLPYLGGIPARHLSFSRDGQWVAYKSELDGTLWRSRIDGTQSLQLTFPPLDVLHPTWSPDGKRIAFEGSGRLYIVPFDGGTLESLLPDTPAGQPNWSPDGKSLLFIKGLTTDVWTACLLDLDSRQIRVVPGSQDFEDPQWSPDGKYIAAGNKRDKKLMLFDNAQQRWSELSDGAPYGWGIRWSSDSKYVYYQHVFVGEEQPLFRVRISDHNVEQVTSMRQILRADVLSYTMTGLTPDNSPLISLLHANSDVNALELELP